MEIETRWGKIQARKSSTMLTRSRLVYLRDNPNLEKLFKWLQKHNVKSLENLSKPLQKKSLEIERETDVLWIVEESYVSFHNEAIRTPNFQLGITRYLDLLYNEIATSAPATGLP